MTSLTVTVMNFSNLVTVAPRVSFLYHTICTVTVLALFSV